MYTPYQKEIIESTTLRARRVFFVVSVAIVSLFLYALAYPSVAHAQSAGDGVFFYGRTATTVPFTRPYVQSSNTLGATSTVVAGSSTPITIIKSSPYKKEMIAGYQDTSNILRVACYDGTTWSNEWSVNVGGSTTTRFDIAYETGTGDAMVLYSANASGTNELAFKTKSGDLPCGNANWAATSSLDSASSTGVVQWVKLASDSRATSSLLAAIWADNNRDLSSMIWSGTAWGNEHTSALESNLATTTAATNTQESQSFDLAYESLSGDLVVGWGSGGADLTNGAYYALCTGGTSSCTWGSVRTAIPTFADDATHISMASNPGSDEIVFASIGRNSSDLQAGIWTGTQWNTAANVDTTAQQPLPGRMYVATGWVASSTGSTSVVAYYDSGATNIGWVTSRNGTTWTAQTDFTPTVAFGTQAQYKIVMNPIFRNELMLLISDASSRGFAKTLRATTTINWLQPDGGIVSGSLSSASTTAMDFAYWNALPFTLSGTLYENEGVTAQSVARNLGIAIGTSTLSLYATTSLASGAWSFTATSGRFISSSTPILVWLDGYGSTTSGAVFTKAPSPTTSITGLDLYQNRLIVRHEGSSSATTTTLQDLSFYDGNKDSDIQFTATTTNPANLYVRANQKLYVWPSDIFTASGTVTVAGNASSTSLTDGSLHIASGATFKSVGTTTLAGSFTASNTASFQQATGTLLFNATTTGKLINAFGQNLGTTTFNGSGGGWTMGTTSTTSNLTITAGTLTAPSSRLTITGNYTNNGTFTHNNGTTTFLGTTAQTATGTLTGTSAFGKLEVKNTSTTTFGAAITATTSFTALEQNSILVFPAGATATLATTTISGTTGNLIKLRSTNAGTQWLLKLDGPYTLSYVDVKDSNACPTTGGTDITWSNLTNSGNNTCWDSSALSYTQPSLISATTVTSVSTSASQSVSVPTSTELVVMFWTAYGGVNGYTLSTSSLDGLGFTFQENHAENGGAGNAYVLGTLVWPYGTSTVNKNFSWTMPSVPSEGAVFILAFIKDASSTAPITDTNGGFTDVGASTSTIDVYSPSTDHLVLGGFQSYLVRGAPDGAGTDQSVIGGIDGFTYNSEVVSLLKENTTDTPTTTLTAGGDYISLMGISIAPKVTGGGGGGGGGGLLLSGTLYQDEGFTPFSIARNLGIAIGTSTASVSATTSLASGAWNFTVPTGHTISSSTPILVWLDGYGTTTAGAVITKAKGTSTISGLDLYQNRLIVRHEGGAGTTTRVIDMAFYDADDDSDIQYVASTSALVVKANQKLYVWPSDSFTASGTIEIRGNASSTSSTDGSFHLATSSMFYAGGQVTIGGSFTASTGAQYYHNEYNTLFNATTTGKIINAPLATLGTTSFNGSGGGWTFATTSTTTNLTITAGTVTGPTTRLVVTGNYTNSGGTFTENNGTTTFGGLRTQTATGTLTGTSQFGNTEVMMATSTWNTASATAANTWRSVAYGNGTFVAVSSSGSNRIMTSTDGITWSTASAPQANSWYSVTYGNGLFVAVSGDGTNRVMTSPDGTTWTARSASQANAWSSVTYGNGTFVAVCSDDTIFSGTCGNVMTSPDGITWTTRTGTSGSWNSVAYGNGTFVAVGAGPSYIMTSPDGTTWTSRSAGDTATWNSVAYGNGTFVAVGTLTSTYDSMTSPDGITWSMSSMPESGNWNSVTYGDGLFVAVSSNTTNRIALRTVSSAWSSGSAPEIAQWNEITYGSARFVGVSGSGTYYTMNSRARDTFITLGASASTTNLTIGTNATVTAPTSTLSISGSYNNLGTYRAGVGTTTFSGASAQTIAGTLTGTSTFNNLAFTGAGAKTVSVSNASTTNVTIDSTSGTVTGPTGYLTITGNYVNSGGAFTQSNSGTTTFNGSSAQVATSSLSGSTVFGNLAFSGAGTKTMGGGATTTNFLVGSGVATVTAPTYLTVSGQYTNSGTTTFATTSTVVFSGTSLQLLSGTLASSSAFGHVIFTGGGAKTFGSPATTTNLIIDSGSGAVTAPVYLQVRGDYSNASTFTANSGTTTFSGNTLQTATGTMSGASSFASLIINNPSGTTTFGSALTASSRFYASTSNNLGLVFASGATTSLTSTTIHGNPSGGLNLRGTRSGSQWLLDLNGDYSIRYVDVQDSDACPTSGTDITYTGATNSGNNTCWGFGGGGSPTLSTANNSNIPLGYPTTTFSGIVITDASTPTITSGNDIRIKIATSTVRMKWDTTDTTATFSGTASGKVSGTVSYEGGGSVLVIDVTSNFSGSDTLTVGGVSLAQFTATNSPAVAFGLYTGGSSDTSVDALDDKVYAITSSYIVSNHSLGQVADTFNSPTLTQETLFRFRLAPYGDPIEGLGVSVPIIGAEGVSDGDFTNGKLYWDKNSDGAYDAGDYEEGEAVVYFDPVNYYPYAGSLDMAMSSLLGTTTRDYIMVADVANIKPGDMFTLSPQLGTTILGFDPVVSASVALVSTSAISPVQHIRGGHGGGGGGGGSQSGAVGGDAPAGGGVQTGGGSGGGGGVDTNTGGASLGDSPGFRAPTANGTPNGAWTNGGNGYNSDGSYATAASTNLRHTYRTFNFNVPTTDTITGIEVRLEGSGTTAAGTIEVALSWDNGTSITSYKTTGTLTGTDAVYTLGGPGDTWGRSWTVPETADGSFAIEVRAQPSSNTVQIDAIRVRIYHQATGGGGGGGGMVYVPREFLPATLFDHLLTLGIHPGDVRGAYRGANGFRVFF